MANPAYRRLVRELETLLPPRLVSQTLHEGLSPLGKTPATVSEGELEAILKSRVLPRLQTALGAEGARTAAERLRGLLHTAEPAEESAAFSLRAQARAIEVLQRGLESFHLLFEWGEAQRLRALLQLIAAEHALSRDAGALIAEAQGLHGLLERKLEAQLVAQAGELTALEAQLADLQQALGPSTRLRRLSTLLTLVRRAHEARSWVPAEVERAHALAAELHKELETARAERARRLAAETRELAALGQRFAALLALEPETARQFAAFEAQLEVQEPLGGALVALPGQLAAAQDTLQRELRGEFGELLTRLQTEAAPPDDALLRDLTLTLKVLATTLPSPADVQRVRDRSRARTSGSEGALAEFHRLEAEAAPYRALPEETGEALEAFLAGARSRFEEEVTLPELAPGWALLERAQRESAARAQGFGHRLHAAEEAARALGPLNTEEVLSLRWTLRRLRAQQEAAGLGSPRLYAELSAALETAEALILKAQGAAQTAREVASQLVSTRALDDALGFFDALPQPLPKASSASSGPLAPPPVQLAPRAPTAGEPVADGPAPNPSEPALADLKRWLEACCAEASVAGAALFTDPQAAGDGAPSALAFNLAVGDLRADPRALQRAARLSQRRADALGERLSAGGAQLLTLETPDCALLLAFPVRGYTLILVTPAPSWSGAARQRLAASLPELAARLQQLA